MTDRPKVESESGLHSSMYARELLGGAAKGTAAGAALGALLKHTGGKIGPGTAAAIGGILGTVHGGLKGRERSLRDVVTQQRMHHRAEARAAKRKKPAEETKSAMDLYDQTKWAAFSDEVEKSAFLGQALGAVGQGVVGGATRLARGAGLSGAFGRTLSSGRKLFGGGMEGVQNLNRAVGAGAVGAAGLGLLGTGALVGRATK